MATQVGPFELVAPLGSGSLGQVWRARHEASGEDVALKVLHPAHRERWRSLVIREVEACARLDHPGIVWIHDFGEDPAQGPWVALELASGGTLGSRLPLGGWRTFADLVDALLSALAHAHGRDVLHRDLKPGNVLLCSRDDPRPGPKLADFGLAALGRGEHGPVGGTPNYQAPEQARQAWREEGPWTDLYALGALLWHAANGAPPRLHPHWSPAFEVPAGLRDWFSDLLRPDPTERTPNAARALHAFRALGTVASPAAPANLGGGRTFDETDDGPRALRPAPRRARASLRLFGLRPVPVVGRAAEQRALLAWVAGEGPPLLVVTGPEGVGKSHLLRWLRTHCREQDLAVVIRLDPHHRDPVAHAVAGLGIEALRRATTDARAVPLLLAWAATADRPLLVVVDATGEPPGAVALAERLSRGRNVRAVVAARVADGTAGRRVLALENVDPIALVRATGVPEAGLAARIAERTAGHPGHTVRMVADLVRAGQLIPGVRGYTLAPDAELGFPVAPREAVRARLAALPPCPELEVAAVLGNPTDLGLWRATCERLGLAGDPSATAEWTASGHLRRTATQLVFEDPVLRAVLQEATSPERAAAIASAGAEESRDRSGLEEAHAVLLFRAGRAAEAAEPLFHASTRINAPEGAERAHHLLDLAFQAFPALQEPARTTWWWAAQRWRAALYANTGDPGRALAHVRSLPEPPAFVVPQLGFLCAQLELRLGRLISALDHAVAAEPIAERTGSQYWTTRARILIELGRLDEAEEMLLRQPPNYMRGMELALLALLRDDPAGVRRWLAEARAHEPPGLLYIECYERLADLWSGIVDPAAVDRLELEAREGQFAYLEVVFAVLQVCVATLVAPDTLSRRIEAATERIAGSATRLVLVHRLLMFAAERAPAEYRDALGALADTQLPLEAT